MATSMTLNMTRLKALCEEWARLTNTPAEAETLELATADGEVINGLAILLGNSTVVANQRGGAILQLLLGTQKVPTNVALVLTRPTSTSPLTDYVATFLSATPITASTGGDGPKVIVLLASSTDAAASDANLESLMAAAKMANIVVGYAEGELSLHGSKNNQFGGSVETALRALPKLLKSMKLLTALLVPKYDGEGTLAIRKAAAMYTAVFNSYVVQQLDAIAADNLVTVTVGDMVQNSQNYLNAANTLPNHEGLVEWRSFSSVLEPQVFVKGEYTEKLISEYNPSIVVTAATAAPLIVRLAPRFQEQAVLGVRTYFFKETAPANAGDALEFAAAVQSLVWAALNVAVADVAITVTTVRDIAIKVLAEAAKLPNADIFAQYLVPELGGIVGPVLTDKRSTITTADTAALIIRGGTSYFIRALLRGVPAGDGTSYDVEVGDSIIAGLTEDFHKRAPRTFPKCLLLPDSDPARVGTEAAPARNLKAITRSGGVATTSPEEARVAKQAKLWEEKEKEFGNAGPKPKSEDPANEMATAGRLTTGAIKCFSSPAAAAQAGSVSADAMFANRDALTVWFPIGGRPTPFHMSTVKDMSIRPDGASGYVCVVTFHSSQESYIAYRNNRQKIFLRELTYKATNTTMFDSVRNALLLGQEKIKEADKKLQSEKGLLPSTNLGVRSAVTAKLPNVFIRPILYAKMANRGTFEATAKGFRFEFSGGGLGAVEVPYDNVAYCICQPAKGDIQVVFHVVLHKAIQWGKEKNGVKEFQVTAVVLEASEGVNGRKMSEAEDLAHEENEKARVLATNKEFIDFSKKLNPSPIQNLFVPNSLYDIEGSFAKGSVRIRGSNKALWQVTETPFQTVLFSDIEIAIMERMIIGGKSFDLVLVPKNYRNKVVTISSIPMKSADTVKNWLCGANLIYLELGSNLSYPRLFKQFESDPDWNPWDSEGWRAMVEDDEEGEEDSESDDTYSGSSDEDSDDSDDSDFDDESDAASSGSSGGGDDDSDNWSDMERRAEQEDEEDAEDSSDDDRPRKKNRSGNAAPPPVGRGQVAGRGGPQRR